MTAGEGHPGPGLQVTLEGDGAPLIGELDHHINGPRAVLGSVDTLAAVVLGVPSRHVRGDASVVTERKLGVLEDVDEPVHERAASNALAARKQRRSG